MRWPSEVEVLRLRDFRFVFGASLVSLLGDGVVLVALSFAVLDLTGSATDLGLVLASETVALAAGLLAGGVVADRVGRRRVMVAADLVRLVSQAVIGVLLVSGRATVAEIAVSQALLGAASGFFNPAFSGLLPLVAGERLQQANALRGMAMACGSIAGPAIAGVLVVATSPGVALLIDAGSYGASALLLVCVRPVNAPRGSPTRFLVDLREGFSEVRARTWVWSVIAVFAVTNTVGAAFPVLGAVIAKQDLGGAGAWAAILAFRAAGGLIAGIALLRIGPRRPLLIAVRVALLSALPMFLLALGAPLVLILPAALIMGVSGMVFNTLWETTLQQHIPAGARSRVSSYDWFGSVAFTPLGFVLIGPLASAIGISGALYLCGAIDVLSVALLLGVRDIWTLAPRPSRLSDAADRA
jgi:Major Facilitator Superfamily